MTPARLLIVLLPWFATLGVSQEGPEPAPAPSSPSAAASAPKPNPSIAFHSDLLNLTFNYPTSLVAQKLPSLKEQHDEIAAKEPPTASAESRKTDECTDKALLALRDSSDPKARPPAAAANHADKGAADSPHAITGKILISRIGIDCMPEAYRSQLDNLSASMSAALAQGSDLHPVDQPIWYDINQTRVHFAAARTAPASNQAGAQSSSSSRWVGSAAIAWNGNLISIVIESNDLTFFNEMLHSTIALGTGKPAPLFPADIGSGKPIEIRQ